ncbi:MAG TPA: RdgB/HAM1 family non-canonical purine NTP pyrophosphatase [Chloroflexota bacterium]|nr:RdgB/HAM1 family non-canonical purine NTP pyrophosphatase [Chloroflexota bacterium]
MLPTTVLLASNNRHKLAEMSELLAGLPIKLVTPAEVGISIDVPETGATYLENARLKAEAFARRSGLLSLADDSGLEVKALGGWPGVHSARIAGPNSNDAQRRELVLDRLLGKGGSERKARFVSEVVLANSRGVVGQSRGSIEGTIALAPRGEGGFGYDPIFIPNGYDRTFGELSPSVKNAISHRARAIAALRPVLEHLSNKP